MFGPVKGVNRPKGALPGNTFGKWAGEVAAICSGLRAAPQPRQLLRTAKNDAAKKRSGETRIPTRWCNR